MEEIIQASSQFKVKNPKLALLQSAIKKELGDQAKFRKDFWQAEKLYKESIDIGERTWARFELGNIQMNRGNYTQGCMNIYRALSLRPTSWIVNRNAATCKSKGY